MKGRATGVQLVAFRHCCEAGPGRARKFGRKEFCGATVLERGMQAKAPSASATRKIPAKISPGHAWADPSLYRICHLATRVIFCFVLQYILRAPP